MRRTVAALGAWSVLVGSLLGATAGPAPGASAEDARIVLLRQDPFTPLGGDLELRLRLTEAPAGSTLRALAYPSLPNRAEFDRVNENGPIGSVLDAATFPVESLPEDEGGVRTLRLGLEAPPSGAHPVRLSLRYSGIYPLVVELRDAEQRALGRLVTYVVVVDPATPPAARLGVAWVWPLDAPPATIPGERTDDSVATALRSSGRLGRQVQALRGAPEVPVTLAPSPETLQTWVDLARHDADAATSAAALRDALSRSTTPAAPYVPLDVPSLLAIGLGPMVDEAMGLGREALIRLVDGPLDLETAMVRPVDPAALERLHTDGVTRVVVDSSALAAGSDRSTIAAPFSLRLPSGATLRAVASDSRLQQLLVGNDSAAVRAQRLVAGLSLVALEAPSSARAVVITNPDYADLPVEMLSAVLGALATHPWLEAMTLADAFSRVPQETTSTRVAVERTLAPSTPGPLPVRLARYAAVQSRIGALHAFAPQGDSHVTLARRSSLASLSSAWAGSGDASGGYDQLRAADSTIDSYLRNIEVPSPSTITLTSRSGKIPLTFRNDTGQPVDVVVTVASPKLLFPEGTARAVTLPPRSTTIQLAVESRSSGDFPLQVTVRSADGLLTISDRVLHVRSAAATAVGLVIMGSAASFLVVWWGFHVRRHGRRARRRRRAAHEPAGSSA